MKLPGSYTREQAIADGYTHEGRYFSVPCWIKFFEIDGEEAPMLAAQWPPLDPWMEFCSYVASAMGYFGVGNGFPVWVGPRIDGE